MTSRSVHSVRIGRRTTRTAASWTAGNPTLLNIGRHRSSPELPHAEEPANAAGFEAQDVGGEVEAVSNGAKSVALVGVSIRCPSMSATRGRLNAGAADAGIDRCPFGAGGTVTAAVASK